MCKSRPFLLGVASSPDIVGKLLDHSFRKAEFQCLHVGLLECEERMPTRRQVGEGVLRGPLHGTTPASRLEKVVHHPFCQFPLFLSDEEVEDCFWAPVEFIPQIAGCRDVAGAPRAEANLAPYCNKHCVDDHVSSFAVRLISMF